MPPLKVSAELPVVVVIPTLGTDHQFNLDYTVADVQALLDVIAPDALIVSDYTDWLRAGCVWSATNPETHAAVWVANEKGIPIFGTRSITSVTYEGTVAAVRRNRLQNPDMASYRDGYRRRLNQTTARIARDYSFNPVPQTLETMLRDALKPGEPAESDYRGSVQLTPAQKTAALAAAKMAADSIGFVIASNQKQKKWAVVLPWERALLVQEQLKANPKLRTRPVQDFLPAAKAALPSRMNFVNISWILSGVLDEWFGIWAPQAFASERIASLLRSLERSSPQSALTQFLKARWYMQNRDYPAAEAILTRLVSDTVDSRIPFPINPKWIRPPWPSIRDKARLNLAFVYDLRGARDSALTLYRGLLQQGEGLNADAQAAGYHFDDIRFVIESYTLNAYTGFPEEAFRHFPGTTGVPACDPRKAELSKK